MTESACFLCTPNPSLVVTSLGSVYAMVGLGPITPTYVMVASRTHVRSLADLAADDPTAIREIVAMRSRLENVRGPLLMTEHGRVPVCRDDDQHEAHCFHGHALFFGTGGDALERARGYYARRVEFIGLEPALAHAAGEQAYLLVSRSSSSFEILSGPLNAPRQLARTLVAYASDDYGAADWRCEPKHSEATEMAASIRAALERRR